MKSENKAELPMAYPKEVFMATMFSGEGHASRDTGLLIALSTDGVVFKNISGTSQPIYTPAASGMRDPIILFRQGEWHLVYSYGPNVSPVLFLAKSSDLLHWTPVVSLKLAEGTACGAEYAKITTATVGIANNFVDVPQWMVDPSGNVHLIACIDSDHHWAEIHPLCEDTATWSDPENWSAVSTITDCNGEALIQGNSFVTHRNGTYYMAFNGMESVSYYLRTSANLTSGWSAARQLNIDSSVNKGDSENLVFLSDGTMRYYISNGNFIKDVIWYVDSMDLGYSWTSPKGVEFTGFGRQKVNWAQFVRITDPAAIAAMVAANLIPIKHD